MFGTPFRRFASRDDSHIPEELRRDRAQNDQKLKSKYERIFEKYERDFEGVGDEIDIVTGEVIVDNGHLARMQHERDTGSSPSRRFLRAFTQELGGEDHQESRAIGRMRAQSRALHSVRSPQSHHQMQSHGTRQHRHSRDTDAATPTRQPLRSVLNNAQSALIPMMQATGAAAGVNPDAIQSLGTALATQIATFLNQQLMSQLGGLQNSALQPNPWQAPSLPNSNPRESIVLRSPTPDPGLSLWAPEDYPYGSYSPPPHHRSRHGRNDRMRRDSDIAMESVEFSTLQYNQDEHDEDHAWDEPPPSLEALKFEGFLGQANYNFQTLALGFANRAVLSEKEDRRGQKRRDQAEAQAWAQQDLSGHVARRGIRGNPFTIDEDRLIVRLKKRNLSSVQIARHLPGRSVNSIAVRYARALKPGSERWKEDRVIELADDYDENDIDALTQHVGDAGPEATEPNDLAMDNSGLTVLDMADERANRKRRRYDSEETILNEDADETQLENVDPVQPDIARKKKRRSRKCPRPDDTQFLDAVPREVGPGEEVITTNDKKKSRKTARKQGFVNFDASSFGAYGTMDMDEQHEDSPVQELVQEHAKQRPGQANVIFRQDPFIYVEPSRSRTAAPTGNELEARDVVMRPHDTNILTLPIASTTSGSWSSAVQGRKSHDYGFPLDPQLMAEMDDDNRLAAPVAPPVAIMRATEAAAVEPMDDTDLASEQAQTPVDAVVQTDEELAQQPPVEQPSESYGNVNSPIRLESDQKASPQRLEAVSYSSRARSHERSSPASASPHSSRPLQRASKGKLLPTTPINRTPLRSSKNKSDADKSSLRTSMLRHKLSSPPRLRGTSMGSATSMSEHDSRSVSIDVSDDDL